MLRTIQAYYQIAYTLRDDLTFGPARNGHRFRVLYLEDPNGHEFKTIAIASASGTGPIYVPGAEVAPPYERSIPAQWEQVPRYTWFNLETGERAILVDGVPSEPFPPVPDMGEVPTDLETEDGDPCLDEANCSGCECLRSCALSQI